MAKYKYLIIGGGVAGTSAAETLRQNDKDSTIAIVGDEPYPLYSKVMMSKPEYFLGKIPADKIFLKKADWYQANRIDYLSGKSVVSLDTAKKTVGLAGGESLEYEKLLLATGSTPRKWGIPGSDKEGIYSLRRLKDYEKIKERLPKVKSAVSVGGGFISFEMCHVLNEMGIKVTLVLRENYFWEPILDPESGEISEREMVKKGINVIKKTEVKEIIGDGEVKEVALTNGERIPCDMVIVSIGNYCDLDFLKEAGVELSKGIVTDEYLKTSAPDVWAAGDAADFADIVLEEQIELGNWVNAQVQGQTAAMNMLGQRKPFKLVSSCNARGFGINITFAGDVRPEKGKKVISRKSQNGTLTQIFVKFGEVIGATFVNGTEELPAICALIEKDIKVSGLEDKLSDPAFDLKTLIKQPA